MNVSTAVVVACLLLCVPARSAEQQDWGEIVSRAKELRLQNRFPEAINLLSDAWKTAERTDVVTQWRAVLCHNLGLTYFKMADYEAAERFLDRALVYWTKTAESNTEELVVTAEVLARLYLRQRRFQRAESFFAGKFAQYANSIGAENPERARWRNNEASLLYYKRDFVGARTIYEEVLRIWEKSPPAGQNEMVVVALNNIAACQMNLNQVNEAIRIFERVIDICRRRKAPGGAELGQSLLNAADAYAVTGRRMEAESLYQQAMLNAAMVYPEDHPLAADIRQHYASSLRRWGRAPEAAPLEKQAKAILKKRQAGRTASVHVSELSELQ